MAKIRVYELAKDLNMTNKALFNKMKELKVEVKSHMSSLNDSDIRKIKRHCLGKTKKKQTDVRARQFVIRRRKKTTEAAADSEIQDTTEVEKETAEPEKKKVVKKKKPETVKNEQQPAAVTDEKKQEDTPDDKQEDIKKEDEKIKSAPASAKTSPKSKGKKGAPAKIIKLVATKSVDIHSETEPESEKKEKQEKEKKPKKRKKKAAPAKIVKVADLSVIEKLKKTTPVDERGKTGTSRSKPDIKKKQYQKRDIEKPASPVIPDDLLPPGESPKQGDDRRKKDKKKPGFDGDKPFAKRKKRKKKSVIEGDALYKGGRGRKKRGRKDSRGEKGNFQQTQITTPKAIKRRIKIDEAIELAELAKRMGIKANEMIAKLMGMGVMATINQTIDFDTAALVATEFDFEVEKASFEEEDLLDIVSEDDEEGKLIGRAPVVTIMGHVDHGKTSLLDVIRASKITSGEAGGITQHIGAYNVKTSNGGQITFLDTPGHAAFTAMRARGAQVTDIVILVVAADDGVMPQTKEAVNHSKAAGVPVVVAVNKMDTEGADPDRVMRQLSELDLLAEEWGGDTIFVKVSAKSGEGIDELLEMILLQSEVLELKANPDRKASGYVVESRLDTGRGPVATVLVKQGTLEDGDSVVCGLYSGRIRAMIDDQGKRLDKAVPSTPSEIVGLNGVPDAGDEFIAVASEKDAKQIASHRMQKQRAKDLAKKSRANLEKMFENLGAAEIKELRLIVKSDVQGSIAALNDSLKDLAKEEVDVKIVHSGTGTINDSDIALATVSDAIIVGFNVRPTPQIRTMAKEENVDMRFYDIIYDVIDDIKTALEGMMPPTFHENIIGRADVRDTFVIPKMGTIAGCQITQGKVVRGKNVRLLRDGVIKRDTQISSLRRFKDDVKAVEEGFECGIGLEKFNDIKMGDVIECYEVEERKYKAES